MVSRPPRRLAGFGFVAALALGGCSTQELYRTGQAWQRQECVKLPDANDRSRCMASAARSYEAYQREADAARSGR